MQALLAAYGITPHGALLTGTFLLGNLDKLVAAAAAAAAARSSGLSPGL